MDWPAMIQATEAVCTGKRSAVQVLDSNESSWRAPHLSFRGHRGFIAMEPGIHLFGCQQELDSGSPLRAVRNDEQGSIANQAAAANSISSPACSASK
jgi:hypothetical protein